MRACVIVRGKSSEWMIDSDLSKQSISDMRDDGLEVILPENSIPAWVVSAGLLVPFCFLQNLWNFKNPFRRDGGSSTGK